MKPRSIRVIGREPLAWDHEAGKGRCRTYVYFVQEGEDGPIKIGFAGHSIRDRLTSLQIGNPRILRVIGAIEAPSRTEREWQMHFSSCRIRGEWFRPTPELTAAIANASIDLTNVKFA